jgi:hypothetical protein
VKTTDEIFDLLVAVDKKVDTHIAVVTWRLNRLEERASRPWQLWVASAGAALALPVSLWAALKGVT